MLYLNQTRKMPPTSTSPMAQFCATWCKKQVKSVKQYFFAVEPYIVYSTNKLLFATNKVLLPVLQKSNVIYRFSCHLDSWYEGRTSKRMQDKIKQHVPSSMRFCTSVRKHILSACQCKSGMAIASHRKSHRIPRFFQKNIASNYRIKTTKKIASIIALQNLTKKSVIFSIILIFLSLIILVSFVWS